MNVNTMPVAIWGLFLVCALTAFLVPFLRSNVREQLTLPNGWWGWQRQLVLLAVFSLLYWMGQASGLLTFGDLGFFALGLMLPWFLSRLNLCCRLQGILLLLFSVAISLMLPNTEWMGTFLLSGILGRMVWRLAEDGERISPSVGSRSTSETVMPSLIWLGGFYWIQVASPEKLQISHHAILLAGLGVSLVLYLLNDVPLGRLSFLKPLLLSLIGGLAMLTIVHNVLLLPDMAGLAGIYAAGVLVIGLLSALYGDNPSDERKQSLPYAILTFALIALVSLAAARFYGTLGWLTLAASALVAVSPRVLVLAGLFWLARVLLQGYIFQFNANVTGINLMHPYSGAMLLGAMMLMLTLPYGLRLVRQPAVRMLLLLSLAVGVPLLGDYFLRAEATAAFLVASAYLGLCMLVLAPVMMPREVGADSEVAILMPVTFITAAMLGGPLIALGNEATRAEKLIILAAVLVVAMLLSGLAVWLSSRRRPVAVSGD